jgi:hypothetical protein
VKERANLLVAQRDALQAERDSLAAQLEELKATHAGLQQERDALHAERDEIANRASVPPSDKFLVKSILQHSFRELSDVFPEVPQALSSKKATAMNGEAKPRRLVKTIGSTADLAHNELHHFAARHAICHYASNTVCTFIPKNACTNLRYSLALANGVIGGQDDCNWIHANNKAFQVGSTKDMLQAEYTFVILRNPFTRLVSFFLDKLVGYSSYPKDYSNDVAKALFPLVDEELTFRSFVDFLWREPEKLQQNEHIRPQVDFLLYQDYDEWFCVENISRAVIEIKDAIGLELRDTRSFVSHSTFGLQIVSDEDLANRNALDLLAMKAAGHTPCPLAIYDPELAYRVSALYHSDIILYCQKFGSIGLRSWLDLCRQSVCP